MVNPGKVNTFTRKLYEILNSGKYNDILTWTPDGTSFVVIDEGRLADEVLPHWFSHNQTPSFLRQLNFYNWKRAHSDEKDLVSLGLFRQKCITYTHPFFHRDHPELLPNVIRKTNNRVLQRLSVDPGSENNLALSRSLGEYSNAPRRSSRGLDNASLNSDYGDSSTWGHDSVNGPLNKKKKSRASDSVNSHPALEIAPPFQITPKANASYPRDFHISQQTGQDTDEADIHSRVKKPKAENTTPNEIHNLAERPSIPDADKISEEWMRANSSRTITDPSPGMKEAVENLFLVRTSSREGSTDSQTSGSTSSDLLSSTVPGPQRGGGRLRTYGAIMNNSQISENRGVGDKTSARESKNEFPTSNTTLDSIYRSRYTHQGTAQENEDLLVDSTNLNINVSQAENKRSHITSGNTDLDTMAPNPPTPLSKKTFALLPVSGGLDGLNSPSYYLLNACNGSVTPLSAQRVSLDQNHPFSFEKVRKRSGLGTPIGSFGEQKREGEFHVSHIDVDATSGDNTGADYVFLSPISVQAPGGTQSDTEERLFSPFGAPAINEDSQGLTLQMKQNLLQPHVAGDQITSAEPSDYSPMFAKQNMNSDELGVQTVGSWGSDSPSANDYSATNYASNASHTPTNYGTPRLSTQTNFYFSQLSQTPGSGSAESIDNSGQSKSKGGSFYSPRTLNAYFNTSEGMVSINSPRGINNAKRDSGGNLQRLIAHNYLNK